MRPLPGADAGPRPPVGGPGAGRAVCARGSQRLLDGPGFVGRRVEVRVSQTEISAGVLDTGELACRHRRVFAGNLTIAAPVHESELSAPAKRRRRE